MKRAIIFWACRDKYYFKAAKTSAKTAKRKMPDVDTVLLTEHPDWTSRAFDRHVVVPEPHPQAITFPPLLELPEEYDSGMYVGSQKIFLVPLYDVFELIEGDRVDIALTHTSGKAKVDHRFPSPSIPEAFPCWRSGLIAFQHHERMRKFFADWRAEFDGERAEYGRFRNRSWHPDQPSLRKALYHSDLMIATLPHNYCFSCSAMAVRGTVRACGFPRDADPMEIVKEANKHAPHLRLFMNGKSTLLEK